MEKDSMMFLPKIATLAIFSRKEMIVIFSLCAILLISIVYKYIVDFHYNTPDIIVSQSHNPASSPLLREAQKGGQFPQQIKFQLDINKAEWYELILLPGIGEVRAKAIVAHRMKYGDFQDINQLHNVEGIKGAVFERIKPYLFLLKR